MVRKAQYIISGFLVASTICVFNAAFCQDEKKDNTPPGIIYSEKEQQLIGYFKNGDYDQTIESAKMDLENEPNNITILTILSNAYLMKEEISSAEETLKRALEIEPNNSQLKQLEEQIAERKRAESEKQNSQR